MRIKPAELLSKTPREFSILMSAEVERRHDDFEAMATQAMMMRAAYHKEKLKQRDLYKRPSGDISTDKTAEDIKERQETVIEQLSKFEEFAGKFDKGEEETNG